MKWCETQTQYGQFSIFPMFGVILRPLGDWKLRLAFGWGFWRISFGMIKRRVDNGNLRD